MAGFRSRHTFSRRAALLAPIPLLGVQPADSESVPEVRVDVGDPDTVPFRREEFGFVGVYDVDWLTTPEFTQMLDHFAASPGAFSGVRFFGALTAGQPEAFQPEGGGTVWSDPDGPMDFTPTFAALEALITRGLTPFTSLGFFPPAVSPSPIAPPASWEGWKRLVRAFLEELATDPRFGPERIADWWFEVWNEPNEGRFWTGTQEDYFALYRATSDTVAETGLQIRLGGPAIAYKPQVSPDDGGPWMERFLRFVAADRQLKLDFISMHRKGTVGDDPPDPRRLHAAAQATRLQALEIDDRRYRGIAIVNNEADEKVGFEVPYAPRMDHSAASWLGAITTIHASLEHQYRADEIRFTAAADNANMQLVQAPFDGRRSLMTYATEDRSDLIKLPVYGFYELLRLLGDRQVPVVRGDNCLFPTTDFYHLCTAAESHVAALLTWYPDPNTPSPASQAIEYMVDGLPWDKFNVALFQIDQVLSNAYTAAGGSPANPFPAPDSTALPSIRQAQEVTIARMPYFGVSGTGESWRETLTLEPYTTLCLWITPYSEVAPDPPAWLEVDALEDRAILRWEPSLLPSFFGYEVYRMEGDALAEQLTPSPLRAAMWVDDAPAKERRTYGVRTLSTSGVPSPIVRSRRT